MWPDEVGEMEREKDIIYPRTYTPPLLNDPSFPGMKRDVELQKRFVRKDFEAFMGRPVSEVSDDELMEWIWDFAGMTREEIEEELRRRKRRA